MGVNEGICNCEHCVVDAHPKYFIGTIHCSCQLITLKALSLERNRVFKCKFRVRRILPSSLCFKRRIVVQNNLRVDSN